MYYNTVCFQIFWKIILKVVFYPYASIFNQTVKDLKMFWRKTNSLKCWRVSLSLWTITIVPAALNSRSLLAIVAGIANSFAATLATQGYFFSISLYQSKGLVSGLVLGSWRYPEISVVYELYLELFSFSWTTLFQAAHKSSVLLLRN